MENPPEVRDTEKEHRELNQKLDQVINRMSSLEKINNEQSIQMLELLQAWKTAKGIVAVIRWTAAVGAGVGSAWAAVKGFKL